MLTLCVGAAPFRPVRPGCGCFAPVCSALSKRCGVPPCPASCPLPLPVPAAVLAPRLLHHPCQHPRVRGGGAACTSQCHRVLRKIREAGPDKHLIRAFLPRSTDIYSKQSRGVDRGVKKQQGEGRCLCSETIGVKIRLELAYLGPVSAELLCMSPHPREQHRRDEAVAAVFKMQEQECVRFRIGPFYCSRRRVCLFIWRRRGGERQREPRGWLVLSGPLCDSRVLPFCFCRAGLVACVAPGAVRAQAVGGPGAAELLSGAVPRRAPRWCPLMLQPVTPGSAAPGRAGGGAQGGWKSRLV